MSLKCCPSNADGVPKDYENVFWATATVALLAGIAFGGVLWILFRSTPRSGKWTPSAEVGTASATMARLRAILIGDPHAVRRVHVTHISKERLGTLLGARWAPLHNLNPRSQSHREMAQ